MLSRTLAVMLAIALAQVAPSLSTNPNAPGQIKKQQKISGQLAIVTLDNFEQWVVRGSDGILIPIDKQAVKGQAKVKSNNKQDGSLSNDVSIVDSNADDVRSLDPNAGDTAQPLVGLYEDSNFEPGSVVSMDCDLDDTDFCTPTLGTATSLVQTPSAMSITTAANTPAIYQRVLVMIMNYSACGMPHTMTTAGVRSIFLGPNGDGAGGVAQKYTQCSYGAFNLNASAFRVEVITPPGCSTAITSSCSWWAISNLLDTAAKAVSSIDFTSFTNYVYILPPSLSSQCGWSGLALLPGKQIWLQTSSYGVNRWATIMQETIHNYGLWHSWKDGVEYEDWGTAMGRGDACPNAAEASRMGWSKPVENGGSINSSKMPLTGVVQSFIVPAAYLTGNGNFLRVQPDWLSSYGMSTTAMNLYISVRVAKGPDAGLGAAYAPRVHVHEVNATMDNGLPTNFINADRRISIIGQISPQSRVAFAGYRLVVYAGSWVGGTDNLQVHLCRYASNAADCPILPVAITSPPPSSSGTPSPSTVRSSPPPPSPPLPRSSPPPKSPPLPRSSPPPKSPPIPRPSPPPRSPSPMLPSPPFPPIPPPAPSPLPPLRPPPVKSPPPRSSPALSSPPRLPPLRKNPPFSRTRLMEQSIASDLNNFGFRRLLQK